MAVQFSPAKMKRGNTMSIDILDDGIRNVLRKRSGKIFLAILVIVSAAIFYFTALKQRYVMIDEFTGIHQAEYVRITAIFFTCVFAITCLFELGELRRLPAIYALAAMLMTALIVLGKVSLLDYQSNDYEIFLSSWVYEYSLLSIPKALGAFVGTDYAPPYLYFLILISRIKEFPWQYLIKAVSVAFDALLGYGIMKLVSIRKEGALYRLGAFFLTMVLPTVVFNGAYWGQCDVVYSSICILAIYHALKRRDALSFLLFGVALSYKLQTVFFLPILFPLWLRRDIRLRYLILLPVGYMLMMAPALLGGKSLHSVLTVHLQQMGSYNFITMNGPSIYEWFIASSGSSARLYEMFSQMAIFLSFGVLVMICFYLSLHKDAIDEDATLLSGLLFLSAMPLLLPKMHERYAFGADVLSLAVCMNKPRRRFLLPFCFGFGSYVVYTAGLAGEKIMDKSFASCFFLAGVILTGIELFYTIKEKEMDLQMVKA